MSCGATSVWLGRALPKLTKITIRPRHAKIIKNLPKGQCWKMRTRLSSREILLEEDVLREERIKNMINIDILLDETIRKAESGTFTLTIF